MDRFRLRTNQDFLKPRIVPKRVPFPTCPQVGKGDAVSGVVDGKFTTFAPRHVRTRGVRSQNMRSNFVSVHPSFKPHLRKLDAVRAAFPRFD